MSEQKTYDEPWAIEDDELCGIAYVVDNEGRVVCADVYRKDAARIVECVNACAGIEDPEAAIEMARAMLLKVQECGVARNEIFVGLDDALAALTPKEKAE